MTLKRRKSSLKVGTVMTVPVDQTHVDDSDPCNKDNCVLSEGFVDYLTEKFGADKNYKVKSTNHAACTNSPCPNSPMSGRSQFVRFERTHKGADQTMRRTSQIGAEIHERWEG